MEQVNVTIFMYLYNIVFNESGGCKNCGRDACSTLISYSDLLEQNVSHGDINSGMMNTESIIRLKNTLCCM